jgi:hypothetical protein
MSVTERRLQLAGISTAVLEGGNGAPVVLLHGPGGYAAIGGSSLALSITRSGQPPDFTLILGLVFHCPLIGIGQRFLGSDGCPPDHGHRRQWRR